MPYMTKDGKRDYKKERLKESAKRKEDRKARGRARTKMGLSDGDPRQVDHKKPLSRGGSNKKSNLRVTSAKANAKKEVARKRRAAKKK
jgi:5-methylcytosine-specific restriction endonuclease McrA